MGSIFSFGIAPSIMSSTGHDQEKKEASKTDYSCQAKRLPGKLELNCQCKPGPREQDLACHRIVVALHNEPPSRSSFPRHAANGLSLWQ